MTASVAPDRPLEAAADYLDGHTAIRRPVSARLEPDALTLLDERGGSVARWPLADIRRAPGSGAAADALRIAPDHASDARLTIRDPAMIAAIRAACRRLDAAPPARAGVLRRFVIWAGVAVGAVLAILFVIAPLMADAIAPLIPADGERALGERIADELVTEGAPLFGVKPGACETPDGRAALDKLTARLAAATQTHLPFRVRVLRSELPNAFALPGGQVFVLSGLLETAESGDEVAGVLAHEFGHVVARDPSRNVLRGFASGVVISYVLGDFTGGFLAVLLAETAVNARYTREAEAAADETALRLLARADLPIRPFAGFFTRIRARFGDSDGYLASHPSNTARERRILEAAQARGDAGTPALGEGEWAALKRICQ